MNSITKKYSITIEGNDLDAKSVQKLSEGDKLTLSRINDTEDTFEISVNIKDKAIDLLEYFDSIGIAPFMDDGSVEIIDVAVIGVTVKQGKSRSKDKTILNFSVKFNYDELLTPFEGESGIFGFIPSDDSIMAMAIYEVINNGIDIVMSQPYLNLFTMDVAIENQNLFKMFDCEFDDEENYNFCCNVLFDEKFEKCKIRAKIYNIDDEDEEFELELSEYEKQSALTLVNHRRIFNGEDTFSCHCE